MRGSPEASGRVIIERLDPLRRRWRGLRDRRVLGVRGLGPVLIAGGGAAIVLVVVVVVGAVHAERLNHRIQDLGVSVRTAQAQAETGQLAAAEATLAGDEESFIAINHSLASSPDFRLLGLLPVARQNLAAVRSSTRLGLALLDDARLVVSSAAQSGSAGGQLHLSLEDGKAPTALIANLRSELGRVIPSLPTSPQPPARSLLFGRVSRAQDELWTEAFKRRHELVTIDAALGVLGELVGASGNRRYLIAVANTAEMRGAGGMILNYGVLQANAGHLSLGAFGDIDQLLLKHPAPAQFPADYNSFFSSYQSNQLWRNATIMTDFTVDAPVLQSMYTAATGKHVDGVLQIDPVGLSAILAGIGPIQDPTLGTLTATNIAPITLNGAYLSFPVRSQRQGFVGNVAKEAFAALTHRPLVDLGPLITNLAGAVADRHLILWSSTPGIEPMVAALGAAGGLPGPGRAFTQLAIENVGANKMDYYLLSSLDAAGTAPTAHRPGRAVFTIKILNPVPPTVPASFVFGPYSASSGDPPGVYRGLVTLYLPKGAVLTGSTLGPYAQQLFENFQNGLTAVTYSVRLTPQALDTTTITATLPPDPQAPGAFTVVPSPRPIPTKTTIHLTAPPA